MSNYTPINLPIAPDWSKAPYWAEFWAIDDDGEANYFSLKPYFSIGTWQPKNGFWLSDKNFKMAKGEFMTYEKANQSLRQRPKIEGLKPDGVWIDEAEALSKPKIETLTISLNTDISGYLAGKNSFITGLIDLLLARMAKEERFSECEYFSSEPVQVNDVVIFEGEYDNRTCYAIVDKVVSTTIWLGRVMEYMDDESEWVHRRSRIEDRDYITVRPINECEAVTYRKAMEAVYG